MDKDEPKWVVNYRKMSPTAKWVQSDALMQHDGWKGSF